MDDRSLTVRLFLEFMAGAHSARPQGQADAHRTGGGREHSSGYEAGPYLFTSIALQAGMSQLPFFSLWQKTIGNMSQQLTSPAQDLDKMRMRSLQPILASS